MEIFKYSRKIKLNNKLNKTEDLNKKKFEGRNQYPKFI